MAYETGPPSSYPISGPGTYPRGGHSSYPIGPPSSYPLGGPGTYPEETQSHTDPFLPYTDVEDASVEELAFHREWHLLTTAADAKAANEHRGRRPRWAANGLAMTDSSRSARTCDVSLGSGGKEGLPTGTPLTAKGNGEANSPVHGSVAPGGAQGPEALSPQAQPAAGAGAPPRRARRRAQRAPSRGGKPPLG